MRRAAFALMLSLVLVGCTTTRFAPVASSDELPESAHLRVTLNDGSRYDLSGAAIENEHVSGRDASAVDRSFPMADVRSIERAAGRRFDTATLARVVGIGLTLTAIIAVSCAIDKDCAE